MKHILRILFVLLPLSSFAQEDEEPEYKAVVIHYNANWQITKPEAAVAKRLTYFAADIKEVGNLEAPLFRHAVTDYYAHNVVMAKGYYNAEGKKWGKWVFYHPNGQVDCEGNFSEGEPSGNWKFWNASGEPLMDVTLKGKEMQVHNLWSESGEQLVKDGHGAYKAPYASVDGKSLSTLEGRFVDGYKTGWWRLTDATGKMELEQMYDSKGKFLSGTIYVNGAPAISKDDLMTLVSLPDYLLGIESWTLDPQYYLKRYPIVADLLGCQVTRVDMPGSGGTSPTNYRFQVVQRHQNGQADTLQYGGLTVEATFKGDLHQYTIENFKGPSAQSLWKNKIEGLLVIKFTVMEDGQVKDAVVAKSVHPLVDEEGLRLINNMPAWNPATKQGNPVASEVVFPMRFALRRGGVEPPKYYVPEQFSNMFRW